MLTLLVAIALGAVTTQPANALEYRYRTLERQNRILMQQVATLKQEVESLRKQVPATKPAAAMPGSGRQITLKELPVDPRGIKRFVGTRVYGQIRVVSINPISGSDPLVYKVLAASSELATRIEITMRCPEESALVLSAGDKLTIAGDIQSADVYRRLTGRRPNEYENAIRLDLTNVKN
jgi:hypothetical protein